MGVYQVPPSDAIAAFTVAMRGHGLVPPPELIADGRIHRCRVEGDRPNKRDGAYLLRLDERPAGGFGSWKGGWNWQPWRYSNGTTTWTPAERAAFAAEMETKRKAREENDQRLAEEARREAVARFGNAGPADPQHSYLEAKQIKAYGLRQAGNELLVPRYDMLNGEIMNLQRILLNGDKRNLTGGRVEGTWHVIGHLKGAGTILLAEGFASAASDHETAGYPAVVSFGSGNLQAAAVELRRQHPKARIVVCGDDDWKKPGNPGKKAATEAAIAADADLVFPTFGPDRKDDQKDFNDMHIARGAEAVRAAIENATKPSIDWPDIDPALVKDTRNNVPTFPVHLLPAAWREWVVATAEGASAPVDYVVMGLLACVAGVTGVGVLVQATSSWSEPLVLWGADIGEPSMGKTPGLAAARRLIDGVEHDAREGDAERQRQHETKAEAAKALEEKWRSEVAEATNNAKPRPDKPADARHVEPFVPTQLIIEDTTIESLVDIVRGNPRGVVLWRDELSGWLQNLGRYSGGNDRPFWLERWSAGNATVNRKNRPAVHIQRLGVSIVGNIQPARLGEICDDDDGMAARFLFTWPERAPYKQIQKRRAGVDANAVNRLKKISMHASSGEEPLALKLDSYAVETLDAFCAEHYAEADDYEGIEAGWYGKGPGNVVRLAGALALLAWSETDRTVSPSITTEIVHDAAGLWADYFWPVARVVFASAGTPAHRRARKAIAWIRRTRAMTISVEDIRVGALARTASAAEAAAVMDQLVSGGVLRPVPKVAKGPGRPAYRWEVNPALHARKPQGTHA
jgi:putative DNA primase/helicase